MKLQQPSEGNTRSRSGIYSSVQFLKGIGPRKAEVLGNVGIRTLYDLLYYIPRRYLDRSAVLTVAEIRSQNIGLAPADSDEMDIRRFVTVVGEVRSFQVVGFRTKARFVLVLSDGTGSLQCVWFGGIQYWKNAFRVGEVIAVSGEPTYYNNVLQFVHPALDRIGGKPGEEIDWGKTLHTGGLVPLYPSSQELERQGFDSAGFRRTIGAVLQAASEIPETLPSSLLQERGLLSLSKAIRQVHFPQQRSTLAPCLERLKYEELFYFQLRLALRRRYMRDESTGIRFSVKSKLARQLVDALPFELTHAQVRVIQHITGEMASDKPMNVLLQGDVGSGKTIVALLAMLVAVDNGFQAVMMAPTEILAEQHYRTLTALLGDLPVNVRLLVGGQRSRLRRDVLDDVQRGSAQIIVGTHALFEKHVAFAQLGLVVIDEQHRFGVLQRASLVQKGITPDVLVMTATPIPRTLSLTLYGDLDVAVIDELPTNRRPVKTRVHFEDNKDSVYHFVRTQVHEGRQAYFVYPMIEESEKQDAEAATVHFEELRSRVFPSLRLGLLHGRLPGPEKDAVMQEFKEGKIDILVSTTVIEVGIDIPNATVMVIENAERFGLSQLHQLRGRVGRGADQSYCLLLAKRWIVRNARILARGRGDRSAEDDYRLAERRLAAMEKTTDGFVIAEIDLQLRGPGDFFGTRQSGAPEFRVADIVQDGSILDMARRDAFAVVDDDPQLRKAYHRVIADHLRNHYLDSMSLVNIG